MAVLETKMGNSGRILGKKCSRLLPNCVAPVRMAAEWERVSAFGTECRGSNPPAAPHERRPMKPSEPPDVDFNFT